MQIVRRAPGEWHSRCFCSNNGTVLLHCCARSVETMSWASPRLCDNSVVHNGGASDPHWPTACTAWFTITRENCLPVWNDLWLVLSVTKNGYPEESMRLRRIVNKHPNCSYAFWCATTRMVEWSHWVDILLGDFFVTMVSFLNGPMIRAGPINGLTGLIIRLCRRHYKPLVMQVMSCNDDALSFSAGGGISFRERTEPRVVKRLKKSDPGQCNAMERVNLSILSVREREVVGGLSGPIGMSWCVNETTSPRYTSSARN